MLWNIDTAQNGAALMTGALDVQQDGWAAWGFPASPGSGMLGGSVLLIKADNSTPSGLQHGLNGAALGALFVKVNLCMLEAC